MGIGSGPGVGKSKIDYSKYTGVKVDEKVLMLSKQYAQIRARPSEAVPCNDQSDGKRTVCVVRVPVILVKDEAGQVTCVAVFPEKLNAGKADKTKTNEKTIVWDLIPPSPALAPGVTFTFFDKSKSLSQAPGMLFLNDTNDQIINGGLGDGTLSTPDATKYHVTDKLDSAGIATYLPIVVRTDNPGAHDEKVSMCATPDPIIWNN